MGGKGAERECGEIIGMRSYLPGRLNNKGGGAGVVGGLVEAGGKGIGVCGWKWAGWVGRPNKEMCHLDGPAASVRYDTTHMQIGLPHYLCLRICN